METSNWGAIFWYFIHKVPCYKKNRVIDVKKFYSILPFLVPCGICQSHSIEYYKKDDYKDCKTLDDLLRWSFRFHNSVNMKRGKKVHYYGILKKYRERTDHNMIYTFISILWINKKRDFINYSNSKSLFQVCHRNFFRLLPDIFPCPVCRENLLLIRGNINSYFINLLMNSHFPDDKSSIVYHDHALSSEGFNLVKTDNGDILVTKKLDYVNSLENNIENDFNFSDRFFGRGGRNIKKPSHKVNFKIYRKIPLLSNVKYKMKVEFRCELKDKVSFSGKMNETDRKIRLSISHNKKLIPLLIDEKEYKKFDFSNSLEINFSLPPRLRKIRYVKLNGLLTLKFKLNLNPNEEILIKSIKIEEE